jgi:hypothetical protein
MFLNDVAQKIYGGSFATSVRHCQNCTLRTGEHVLVDSRAHNQSLSPPLPLLAPVQTLPLPPLLHPTLSCHLHRALRFPLSPPPLAPTILSPSPPSIHPSSSLSILLLLPLRAHTHGTWNHMEYMWPHVVIGRQTRGGTYDPIRIDRTHSEDSSQCAIYSMGSSYCAGALLICATAACDRRVVGTATAGVG